MTWRPISTAPNEGTFQLAAWFDGNEAAPARWIVGEAERDPEGKFWWENTRGDYHADDLVSSGLTPVFWQPMAPPPDKPHTYEKAKRT